MTTRRKRVASRQTCPLALGEATRDALAKVNQPGRAYLANGRICARARRLSDNVSQLRGFGRPH